MANASLPRQIGELRPEQPERLIKRVGIWTLKICGAIIAIPALATWFTMVFGLAVAGLTGLVWHFNSDVHGAVDWSLTLRWGFIAGAGITVLCGIMLLWQIMRGEP